MGCGSSVSPIRDKYEVVGELGKGMSSCVESVRDKETGKRFAMKRLDRSNKELYKLYSDEVKILKLLSKYPHNGVLQYVDSYEDINDCYILTQLCEGGEVFDRIASGDAPPLTEMEAINITKMMIEPIAHLHKLNIVHRDLKPENYVLETTEKTSPIRLIDFGCAAKVRDSVELMSACGTLYYLAPEIVPLWTKHPRAKFLTGATWKKADMWSIGIIIYIILVGVPPFFHRKKGVARILKKIQSGKYKWPKTAQVSDEAKDLVANLLTLNPYNRYSAEQALNHPWIKSVSLRANTQQSTVSLRSLTEFQHMCKLKKALGRCLINRMTQEDKAQMQALFREFDTDGDGRISADEMMKMMANINGYSSGKNTTLFDEVDEDGDGLDLDEFALMHSLKNQAPQPPRGGLPPPLTFDTELGNAHTFGIVDKNRDGKISDEELQHLLSNMDADAARKLVKEVGDNGKEISFEGWVKGMQRQPGQF